MIRKRRRENGITIIELLVGLVIFSIVIGGIYKVLISQSRAYTVQDQVVETQQSIRSAMELILRDLRMTGFDDDHPESKIHIHTPIEPGTNQITIDYEYDHTTRYSIEYSIRHSKEPESKKELIRKLTKIKDDGASTGKLEEILLESKEELELNFTYGVDTDGDGAMDRFWVNDPNSTHPIVAVRVRLTARPDVPSPEDQKMMSPRTLESAITLRNLSMRWWEKKGL